MPTSNENDGVYRPWLARFCVLALLVTIVLLFAGGFTTSIQAGMAFLDWPLSNGSLNPPGWMENEAMRAEHSHRLLAMTTGLLAIGAVAWTQVVKERRWVRRVAIGLLMMIIFQGMLGGARVLLDNKNTHTTSDVVAHTFAVLHAGGAEITACLWVTMAAATSQTWILGGAGKRPVAPAVRQWAAWTTAMIFIQIMIGAIVRQGGFALSIGYFPWLGPDHALWPAAWNVGVAANFAHRVGAAMVCVALAGLAFNLYKDEPARRQIGTWMTVALCVLPVQIYLGALVIWTNKNADAATVHLLGGAFLLASTWMVTLLAYRSAWWPLEAAERAEMSQLNLKRAAATGAPTV